MYPSKILAFSKSYLKNSNYPLTNLGALGALVTSLVAQKKARPRILFKSMNQLYYKVFMFINKKISEPVNFVRIMSDNLIGTKLNDLLA